MTFSSEHVFDDALERPFVEGDETCPTCLLGLSKAEAERRVARAHGDALVIRMSRLLGSGDEPHRMMQRRARRLGSGIFFTARYLPDVVRAALDLLIDGETGTWHLANQGAVSLDEMARIFTPAQDLAMPGSCSAARGPADAKPGRGAAAPEGPDGQPRAGLPRRRGVGPASGFTAPSPRCLPRAPCRPNSRSSS